jgi:dipeptidyl aminopeptidase/acylaminoacyl peptidase
MNSIAQYLRIWNAYTPSFDPDGESLSFVYDVTGTTQLWHLTEPKAWPTQLVATDDPVSFAVWSPTSSTIIYGMDSDGDENQQLYGYDHERKTNTRYTDADAQHKWGGWSSDGERFAFTANRRNAGAFDVYVQRASDAPGDESRVYRGDGWYNVAGWGPDDRRLLVTELDANLNTLLYVLDLEMGTLDPILTDVDDCRIQSVNWGPEGDGLYLVTDRNADTLRVVRVDVATGEVTTVVKGGDWNIEGLNVHTRTGRFAYGRNVHGYTEITTGRLTGPTRFETFSEPELPDGVFGEVTFAPDGDRFALTVTNRRLPPNVFVVDVRTGAVEQWTGASAEPVLTERLAIPELVRYESFDGTEILGFLSVPKDADGPVPFVVDFHGGPEEQRRPSFAPVVQYLLAQGYGVFEPNVRGSTGYGREYASLDDGCKRTDVFEDIRTGVEWLRGRHDVSVGPVATLGSSYGGFLALASVAEFPNEFATAVSICGISDLVKFLENTGEWRRHIRESEYGSLEDDREFLAEISPIRNADDIGAPLFLVHGANDPRVPVEETQRLADAVGETNRVETLVFEDEGHGLNRVENQIRAYRQISSFLDNVMAVE